MYTKKYYWILKLMQLLTKNTKSHLCISFSKTIGNPPAPPPLLLFFCTKTFFYFDNKILTKFVTSFIDYFLVIGFFLLAQVLRKANKFFIIILLLMNASKSNAFLWLFFTILSATWQQKTMWRCNFNIKIIYF